MPVEPIDFETHSERAKDDYTDEIAFRCIISRKYYYQRLCEHGVL